LSYSNDIALKGTVNGTNTTQGFHSSSYIKLQPTKQRFLAHTPQLKDVHVGMYLKRHNYILTRNTYECCIRGFPETFSW